MLILLVGLTSSGKSTAAEILEEMSFQVLSTGDVIREEIKNRGLPYTRENDVKISQWFNEQGEEKVIERLTDKLRKQKVVIDGIRTIENVRKLEEVTGQKPVIVAIKADFELRYSRECERKKFSDENRDFIKERDKVHLDMGTRKLMENADFVIDNTSLTKEQLRKELEKILDDISKSES